MRLSRGLLLTASLIAVASCAVATPHSRVGKSTGTILGAPSPVSGVTGTSGGSLGNNPTGASLVTYDTSVGNGVGADGFAALPLYNPGTDSTDVAAGAPTMDAGACTYTGASRTVTCTATGPMFRWTGAATIGQAYHVKFNTHVTSFAHLIIKDENGTVEWSDAFAGNGTSKDILSDGSFLATGHDIILDRTDDAFAGSIQVVGIYANTGGIPGRRFYINASTGSDSYNGTQMQNPATPAASGTGAAQFEQDARGDQLLYAQGVTPSGGMQSLALIGGVNPVYPFVIQSYDPADPTNEAKMGRATGSNRPLFSSWGGAVPGLTDPAHKYRAIRGVEFNPGNVADQCYSVSPGAGGTLPDYFLFENDVFAYTCLSLAEGVVPGQALAKHIVVRNSALYGQWDNIDSHQQGLYAEGTDGLTAEDDLFWHNGWNVNATRATISTSGGPTIYNHPIYAQQNTINTLVRRSAFIDSSTDGGELKGGGIYLFNLSLKNPIGAFIGFHENEYSTLAPLGVYIDDGYNVVLGGDGSQDWGLESVNGRTFSLAHHNVVARAAALNGYTFMADAGADAYGVTLPSYITYDRNVAYQWTGATGSAATGLSSDAGAGGFIHATFSNNLWDDATSGSNTNNSGHSFPNAYTPDGIGVATGYADLATARADWLLHPEQHKWELGNTLALAGYGITIPALADVATDLRVTAGIATGGQFVGSLDGSVFTWTGAPACFSLDSSARAWRADSTCTPTTATVLLTETKGVLSHTTTLPLAVYARPVLSSLTVTPGSNTANVAVSTTVGSGFLYWSVGSTSSTASWQLVRASHGAALNYIAGTVTGGNQAVTATGAQSISVTGLTPSTAEYVNIAQLDGNNNPSLTSTLSFTTTSGASATTLNPSDKTANLSLTAGNLTALATGSNIEGVRATKGVTSGKSYWEFHDDVENWDGSPGVADASAAMGGIAGNSAIWGYSGNTATTHAAGWFGFNIRYNTTNQSPASPPTQGHVEGTALDMTAHKVWFSLDNVWQNGDPNTGTGGLDITGIGSTVYPGWQGQQGDKATFRPDAASQTYSAPTGFTPLG